MVEIGGPVGEDEAFDDRLALLFMCCHPALPLAGRVALTLKTVTGLSTREIARAFVVTEATMSKRLLRTKQKIEQRGHQLPDAAGPPARRSGPAACSPWSTCCSTRATRRPKARRSARTSRRRRSGWPGCWRRCSPTTTRWPASTRCSCCSTRARDARAGDDGELLTMEEQDRGRWDRASIERGLAELDRARAHARPAGPYRLQAEIAARHASAATAAETDWASIVVLYDALLEAPNPVVALNRAVAIGFRDGPDAGLAALDEVDLPGYHLVEATRADFLRRAGRPSRGGRRLSTGARARGDGCRTAAAGAPPGRRRRVGRAGRSVADDIDSRSCAARAADPAGRAHAAVHRAPPRDPRRGQLRLPPRQDRDGRDPLRARQGRRGHRLDAGRAQRPRVAR